LNSTVDFHDAVDDSTLEGGSLWVPDVTNDGQVSFRHLVTFNRFGNKFPQIYYVHSITGERVRDLPDDDSDTQSVNESYANTSTIHTTRFRSDSQAPEGTRNTAGFGVHYRSSTPEPWMKRLTDDGLTFYYVNSVTNETSWSPPAPTKRDKARVRSHSKVKFESNHSNVAHDSPDIHPIVNEAKGTHSSDLSVPSQVESNPAETTTVEPLESPSVSTSLAFNQLVSNTRAVIASILDSGPNGGDIMEKVEIAVIMIRQFLLKAGALSQTDKLKEALTEKAEISQSRVKTCQRKLVITLSKVVLDARVITLNPTGGLDRVQQSIPDLDECVVNLAQEIETRDLAGAVNQRLVNMLTSEDDAGGGETGLTGVGLNEGRGFGFVPTAENAPHRVLSSILVTDFQDQATILRDKAEALCAIVSSSNYSLSEGISNLPLSAFHIF
jgi:son of sevenless